MATNTTNYNFVKQDENEFYDVNIVNQNLDGIDGVLSQYEFQTPTISGTQIRLTKQSNANRLFFKLESELSGNITVSINGGATSKNLVDVEGVQVTSLDKGFHEIVATANFFIIRNKGGLSKTDLEALITIVNEAESNESVLRTEYINAVNGADSNISLPSTATWNDILLQIPNLTNGKKKAANGSVLSSSTTLEFINGGGTAVALNYLEVSGLDFIPSVIVAYRTGSNPDMVVLISGDSIYPGYTMNIATTTMTYSASSGNVKGLRIDGVSAYVNVSGFRIPINHSLSANYNWYAFE